MRKTILCINSHSSTRIIMKRSLIITATLGVLLYCISHTALQAQSPATLLEVILEESYPANKPVSIDLVIQSSHSTILPHELEFECTVGNKPPVVLSYPDTIMPNTNAYITIHGLVFDKGSDFLEVLMKQIGFPPLLFFGNGSDWFVVQGIPFPGETLVEDFEGVNHWYASPGTVWEQDTPAGTQITAAHSGTQAWVTVAAGDYPPSVTDYLYSPMFPYDSIGVLDTVLFSFYHFYALADTNDRVWVEYSTDSGATWGLLGTAGDPLGTNWYGHPATAGFNSFYNTTQGWEYAAYKLPIHLLGMSGVLQFRFVFSSDASGTADGWAIDDVTLKPYKPPYDAGIVDMLININYKLITPGYEVPTWPLINTNFRYYPYVKIQNFGTDTLTAIPVMYMSNFGNPVFEQWTGVLPPGDTVWYMFQTGFLPILGMQKYTFATALAGDLNILNDGFKMPVTGVIAGSPPDVSVEEISENDSAHTLLVYPNPASSVVNFEMEESTEKISSIELYNICGRLVAEWHPQTHTAALNISHLSGGIYLVRVTVGQKVITRKVVVRNN